jgi:hypothetical protein
MENNTSINLINTYVEDLSKLTTEYKTKYATYISNMKTHMDALLANTATTTKKVNDEIAAYSNTHCTDVDGDGNITASCANSLWKNYGCTNTIKTTSSGLFDISGQAFDVSSKQSIPTVITNMGLFIATTPDLCPVIPGTINIASKIINSSKVLASDLKNLRETNATKTTFDGLNIQIKKKASDINTLITQLTNPQAANQNRIKENVEKLQEEIAVMQREVDEYAKKTNLPTELDGNYEVTSIHTTSSFYKYILYFFVTIFVIGCLVVIYWFPTLASEKIDYFMLALAGIIAVYYIQDYFVSK